jgi:hypothetical protein
VVSRTIPAKAFQLTPSRKPQIVGSEIVLLLEM